MRYQEYKPAKEMRDYVQLFYLFDITVPGQEISIVPGGGLGLVFNLGSPLTKVSGRKKESLSRIFLVGQFTEHHFWNSDGRILLFGARFHPAASAIFARAPVSNYTNVLCPAEKVLGVEVLRIREKAASGIGIPELQAELELFLGKKLKDFIAKRGSDKGYKAFKSTLQDIIRAQGNFDMDKMSMDYGLSARRIEQLYREYLGIGPKMFARIKRFHYALKQINGQGSLSLTNLALNSGYYDQAHFNRDFKKFMGLTPSRYLAMNQKILAD